MWARLGWGTRVVGTPGDRGIDVVAAYFDDLDRRGDNRGAGGAIEAEAGDMSLRDRLRGAIGSLFS